MTRGLPSVRRPLGAATNRWLIPVLLAIGTMIVSGWRYWQPGLVIDEVSTLMVVRRSWASMFTVVTQHADAVHALYYSMMHVVFDVLGYSPAIARGPSVLAMGLTAVAIYLIAREFWGTLAGVLSAVIFAILPVTTSLAQFARPLPISLAWISWALFALVRATKTGVKWWVFGLLSALAIGTNIYSVLVLVCGLVIVKNWRPFVTALGIAVLVASPIIWLSVQQRNQISWLEQPSVSELIHGFVEAFLIWTDRELVGVWGLAALFAFGSALVWTLKTARSRPLLFVLAWLFVPTMVLWLGGFVVPLFSPRYVAISAPALALLFGAGLAATQSWVRQWRLGLVTLAVLTLGLITKPVLTYLHQEDSRTEISLVAAAVAQVAEPDTAVVYSPGSRNNGGVRYLSYAYPEAFAKLTDITLATPYYDRPELWETEVPLVERVDQLKNFPRVLLVTAKYDGTRTTANREIIEANGFAETGRTDIHDWSVVTYTRVP